MLALLTGMAVFLGGFVAVIAFSDAAGERAQNQQHTADRELDALRLAEILLGQPGLGWYTDSSCYPNGTLVAPTVHGDSVRRVGLGAEACTNASPPGALVLSYDKVKNLGSAAYAADGANGFVDYEEAHASLGLSDASLDFHLRTWPLLPDIRAILGDGYKDPYTRPAYIGDYLSVTGNEEITYLVDKTCGVTDLGDKVTVWADVTNNGTLPTAFEGRFTVPLDDNTLDLYEHSKLALGGQTVRVSVNLTKSSDWDWATSQVTVTLSDLLRSLGTCTVDLSSVSMTALTAKKTLNVYAGAVQSVLGGAGTTAKVYYEAYEGDGDEASYSDWRLTIRNSLGLPVFQDLSLHSRGWESFTFLLPDVYEIRLESTLGVLLDRDWIHVVDTALSPFTPSGAGSASYSAGPSVVPEVTYVETLIQSFDPYVFSVAYDTANVTYQAGGDVFPDLKTVLNNDLPEVLAPGGVPTLDTYNMLVVGSDVDHNAMTSASAKQTIRDWVYAGGYLMVLGSFEQSVQWLQPIFHSAIESASGGLSTPDQTHPILHTPNDLDYTAYDNQDLAWGYNAGSDQYFTHVIAQGDDDVLAVSDAGAFGEGRVLLSSYRPYDLQGTGGPSADCMPGDIKDTCASLQLFHNYIVLGFRDLYLDYGPPIPEGQGVGVTTRIATLDHPDLGQPIELAVQVYIFG